MGSCSVGSELLQLVTFRLGGEEYAIDILKVQEVDRMVEITALPNGADGVEGVINLRGKVIPVINLRKRFGLAEKESDAQSRIMVVDVGTTVGLVVDSVSEVLRLPSGKVEPAPAVACRRDSEFVMGVGKLDDRLMILLDIDRLFNEEKLHVLEG